MVRLSAYDEGGDTVYPRRPAFLVKSRLVSVGMLLKTTFPMSFQSILSGISAHKFTISVPNLVWVLGFSLGTTLVTQWVIMHIASLKVIRRED